MSIIEVKNLTKTYLIQKRKPGVIGALKGLFSKEYTKINAVNQVSFQVEEGELVGFLGPNGAGKTTTLKMLSGILYPTLGTARVLGFLPWERKNEFRKQFALVMGQKNQLWWDLPAQESLFLNKEIYGIPSSAYYRILDEMVELLNVKQLLSVMVRELSLGERMKMELIACLLHSPRVLFMDEPTIGLDVVAQKNIRDFVQKYNKKNKITILLTSHYMNDIQALCKRVIVINYGQKIFDGPLAEIIEKFSAHKLIKIVMNNPKFSKEQLSEFGEIVEWESNKIVLKVDRNQIASASSGLLNQFEVSDITIEEIPIEDVIGEVFSNSERHMKNMVLGEAK
jgi:ABC-2 type transport system ATP-binding protein